MGEVLLVRVGHRTSLIGQVTSRSRVVQWLFAKQKFVVLTYLPALYHNAGGYALV